MPERYKELVELIESFEKDYIKFYERGNKTADKNDQHKETHDLRFIDWNRQNKSQDVIDNR